MKSWTEASLIRALKTVCQTAVATIGTATVLGQVDWVMVASASALAGILSILTSLAGLPEVGDAYALDYDDETEDVRDDIEAKGEKNGEDS